MKSKKRTKGQKKTPLIRLRWVIFLLIVLYGLLSLNKKFKILEHTQSLMQSIDISRPQTDIEYSTYVNDKSTHREAPSPANASYWIKTQKLSDDLEKNQGLKEIPNGVKILVYDANKNPVFWYKFGPYNYLKETREIGLLLKQKNIYYEITLEKESI